MIVRYSWWILLNAEFKMFWSLFDVAYWFPLKTPFYELTILFKWDIAKIVVYSNNLSHETFGPIYTIHSYRLIMSFHVWPSHLHSF